MTGAVRRCTAFALAWVLTLGSIAAVRTPAQAATCAPQAGYAYCQVFAYTGALQTFTVPAGVTSLYVELWGAGGGGTNSSYYNGSYGAGGGGYTAGTVAVTAGQTLGIEVGQGGQLNSTASTYGGGGAGGSGGSVAQTGSSGGGMSALWSSSTSFTTSTAELIAGGGGGASTGESPTNPAGGGGGGSTGGADASPALSGRGGTQTAGGAGATTAEYTSCGSRANPAAGAQFTGGAAGVCTGGGPEGGGGGGGGWFGGGGGTSQYSGGVYGPDNGAGGGGSGYIGGTGVTGATLTPGATATSTSGGTPGNASDSEYVSGVAQGGGQNANGGNGEIVVQYNGATSVKASFSPASVTGSSSSTLTITIGNASAGAYTLTAAFTDTMPTGVSVTSSSNAGTCAGVTVTGGGVSMASGTSVPVGGCTIVVNVSARTGGTFANTTSSLATSAGTAAAATASLTSTAPALTTIKAFSPSTIFAGGTSTVTVTIANTATGAYALTGLAMSADPLPSGVVVASAPASSTTCGSGTVSATAGASTFSLSGGTLAAGATCSVSVNVTSAAAGSYLNDIPAANFSTTQGSTSAADATATLLVTSILIGPVGVPNATGSYDGVVAATTANDFVEKAFAPAGFNAVNSSTVVGSPSGNAYTSAVTGIAVRHQLHNYGTAAANVVFTATAPTSPSGWTVGVYNDSSGSLGTEIAGTASSNAYTTTTPLSVAAGADAYVWTEYAAPAGVTSFVRFDATLAATDNAYSFNTNGVHDELYSGFLVHTKSYVINATNCTPATQPAGVWCPGATLTYSLDVRNIALAANGTTPSSATLQASTLLLTDNGTNPNSWAAANGYMNAPGIITASGIAPSFVIYYYGSSSSATFPPNSTTTNLVQAFTAVWTSLNAGQSSQITFSTTQY